MIKLLNRLLSNLGIQIKRNNALLIERAYLDARYNGSLQIFKIHKKYADLKLNDQIEAMVFSKDRPMQLHALLTSYFENVANYCPLLILYKSTNEKSRKAYEELKVEFFSYPIIFTEETDFKNQVIEWLSSLQADRIFFMTDDAIFLNSFDLKIAVLFNPLDTIFSLTKGNDLTYCFTLNVEQEIPQFCNSTTYNTSKLNFWKWDSTPNSPDWSYPISVDGNFYLREEILQMVKNIYFKNPNSLEASLQIFIEFFITRQGVCFDKAKLVNIPCNLVQNEFNNRSTGLYSAEELQDMWDAGKRIQIEDFKNLKASDAVHMRYSFKNRDV